MQKTFRQKQKMGKSLKIIEQLTRELWYQFKGNNRRITGSPEDQEDNPDDEPTVKDIITEKFQELKSACTQIREA